MLLRLEQVYAGADHEIFEIMLILFYLMENG